MSHYKKERRTDEQIRRLYAVAVAAKIPVSIMRSDGYLLDMTGWMGDVIKHELLGYRWMEYVYVEDLDRVREFIKDAHDLDVVIYRGVCPGADYCIVSLCRLGGETLRLMAGISEPKTMELLPAAPCLASNI